MDDYAGRVLADRYRLPLPPEDGDGHDLTETRAFDTYSGQEVLVRQVPLPEFVDAEVLDGAGPGGPGGFRGGGGRPPAGPPSPSCAGRSRPPRPPRRSPTTPYWTRSSTSSRRPVRCG